MSDSVLTASVNVDNPEFKGSPIDMGKIFALGAGSLYPVERTTFFSAPAGDPWDFTYDGVTEMNEQAAIGIGAYGVVQGSDGTWWPLGGGDYSNDWGGDIRASCCTIVATAVGSKRTMRVVAADGAGSLTGGEVIGVMEFMAVHNGV